jgi:hypothetical protein
MEKRKEMSEIADFAGTDLSFRARSATTEAPIAKQDTSW